MFKPSPKRILIKPDEFKSEAGIVLPETIDDRPMSGVVIEVGDEITLFKKEDHVTFSRYGADDLEIAGKRYFVVTETNILGTFV